MDEDWERIKEAAEKFVPEVMPATVFSPCASLPLYKVGPIRRKDDFDQRRQMPNAPLNGFSYTCPAF